MTRHRQLRGRMADASGRAAEAQVKKFYLAKGARLLAERWRSRSGEVDLIFREGSVVVFVEVKSSARHEAAAALSPRQQARIMAAAGEYAGTLETGSLTEMRFDVALLDGRGGLRVIEAALGF